jgi:TonB family protein
MNRKMSADELDLAIEQFLAGSPSESGCNSMLAIGKEIRLLPSSDFKDQLRDELLRKAEAMTSECPQVLFSVESSDLLSSLERRDFSFLPADPRSFLFSFLSHVAAVVLLASGIWVTRTVVKRSPALSELTYIPIPLGQEAPHGGGGGGDHSTVEVSRGTPPKFGVEQLAPPAIVVRNPSPKLPVEPTVLGPPQIKLPQSNRIGDLLSSNPTIPSNGVGRSGGMGNSVGTGLGPGDGVGAGPGSEAGFGGEAFRPGNGVSAPRAIYDPEPEYSDEARRIRYQGVVVLSVVVDPSGHPRNIHILRALGLGLDEKAIQAVQKWKFEPGMKDGRPVAVAVNVEVNFRLY